MPNNGALIIGQALKAARFDAPSIANALISAEVYPALTAEETGRVLLDPTMFPALTPDEMREALTAAPFPATAIEAAEAVLYPSAAGNVFWDFSNTTSVRRVSSSTGAARGAGLSAVMSQTGGGPAETFGTSGVVFLTRGFGTDFPYIDFTCAAPAKLRSIAFQHFHNHNPDFPTYPYYSVQIQINAGAGFVDAGLPLLISSDNYGAYSFIALNGFSVPAGTHRIRWFPKDLKRVGTHRIRSSPEDLKRALRGDTNTDYFALHDVVLSASADTAVWWILQGIASQGGVSTCVAASAQPWAAATLSQTGAGPYENFTVNGKTFPVFLTRFLGTQYPFIELTLHQAAKLEGLSFSHYHNHNPGYPSNPSYQIQMQIDTGPGFVEIGHPFAVSSANNNAMAYVDLGGFSLSAGTTRLRWYPQGLARGAADTNTEYFAIADLMLTLASGAP